MKLLENPLAKRIGLGVAAYFMVSIAFLSIRDVPIVQSVLGTLAFFVLATSVSIFGARSVSNRIENDPGGDTQPEDGRSERRIKALRRDQRRTQDKVLQMGALVLVLLISFAGLVYNATGMPPTELYIIPPALLAVIWLFLIIFLPRPVIVAVFLLFSMLRVGSLVLGPQVLGYLPNFIMLPFFYLAMMFFMFGSIMIPNLQQFKYYRPGQGDWETPKGSTRGQFLARAMIETQIDRFTRYAAGETDRKPTRGMVFTGPPGTGKTLYTKEMATELSIPFVMATGAAFNAPFMGFGMLIPLIVKAKTEALAREYGGAVIFIDEAEIVFGARSGMQPGQQPQMGLMDVYDNGGDVLIQRDHEPIFMMPGAGAGGAGAAIFPLLTWMSGTPSPPFLEKFLRSSLNTLFDALLVPVTVGDRVLRLPPGKPRPSNVMFIAATNRFFMFDPAIVRPGRLGIVAEFVIPDEDERVDIGGHYLRKLHDKGYCQDDLITDERILEFARATPNTSPADQEQIIEESVDVRIQHVAELRRVKGYADRGEIEDLHESDQKFWLRYKSTVYDGDGNEVDGWDDERVDWSALMASRSTISFGRANPQASNETTKRKVAFHELGHFIAINTFNKDRVMPTLLSVIPRRGNLGMVAHVPHDTREQHPQEFFEGNVRTSVAAWVTERFFFGENLPGVSGDLRNATGVATLMVGKFGMSSFDCSEDDREYYARVGELIISEPEVNSFNPQATSLVQGVLGNADRRKEVSVIIGMAAIDAYRLIRANQGLFLDVIPEFLRLDEFSGARLEALWDKMTQDIVPLSEMSKEDREAKPDRDFAVVNSFYEPGQAEGAELRDSIIQILEAAS